MLKRVGQTEMEKNHVTPEGSHDQNKRCVLSGTISSGIGV